MRIAIGTCSRVHCDGAAISACRTRIITDFGQKPLLEYLKLVLVFNLLLLSLLLGGEGLLLSQIDLMLQIPYLIKLLTAPQLHRLPLALRQFQIVLRNFQ